jgi:hypothetical protein
MGYEEFDCTDDFVCQGSSDGSLEGGHMANYLKCSKKTKVIDLDCSFQNLFELCSKVLLLWRYEVKDFSEHCVFLCFLYMKTQ